MIVRITYLIETTPHTHKSGPEYRGIDNSFFIFFPLRTNYRTGNCDRTNERVKQQQCVCGAHNGIAGSRKRLIDLSQSVCGEKKKPHKLDRMRACIILSVYKIYCCLMYGCQIDGIGCDDSVIYYIKK